MFHFFKSDLKIVEKLSSTFMMQNYQRPLELGRRKKRPNRICSNSPESPDPGELGRRKKRPTEKFGGKKREKG
jgi:hypothetical protein